MALLGALLVVGCTSSAEYAAGRRQRLLALYPPGTLTQADIRQRYHGRPPNDAMTRPAAGWAAAEYPGVGQMCLASEARTGKRVQSVERYLTPDGFVSLCYVWFYYDADTLLTDTEWEWSSD